MMTYDDFKAFITDCEATPSEELNWVDRSDFDGENTPGAAPGGYLNPYGYVVVATTVGGNAVLLSENDDIVTYADHEWFSEDEIDYCDVNGDGDYHILPYSPENVRLALYELAPDRKTFISELRSKAIDRKLAELD